MNDANRETAGWKEKTARELKVYSMNFAYLAVFFGVFIVYKRLTLAEYHIGYADYGTAILKALILAKVIAIGDLLHLARHRANNPLIFPTLWKAAVFTVWVGLFALVERTVTGLLRGKGWAGGFEEIGSHSLYGVLAECLVTFVAFIPFFAIRELAEALGEGKMSALFFWPRKDQKD